MTDTSREAFEKWAVDILGDNPNWCESGDCELAWQSWQASRESEKAQPVATVQCVRGVTIGYLDVMQPVGTKLYTHPAQQIAVPVPDMFWNHDDADKLYSSISEFLNDEMCSGTELAIGDIRTVQRAVRLPNIDIRITSVNDDECDADYKIVEAQGAKP